MRNKELLEKKLKIQNIKNILKKLKGIAVIQLYDEGSEYDNILHRLSEIGYYSDSKQPDAKLSIDSEESAIYEWIIAYIKLENDKTVILLIRDIWVKIQILDKSEAVKSLWNQLDSVSQIITILDEQTNMLLEISNDSRDEQNYLFDKYNLS